MSKKFMQGLYNVINKDKYVGDVNNVIYRSSWELKYLYMLDKSDDILKFSSEETIIPYQDYDGRIRRYFVDFKVQSRTQGISLIEIKPFIQTQPPILKENKSGRPTKSQINQILTYDKNQRKWKAAEKYCKSKNWTFRIVTEKDLFSGKTF